MPHRGNDGRPPMERPPTDRKPPTAGGGSSSSLRWVPWVLLAIVAAAFLVTSLAGGSSSKTDLTYTQFVNEVNADNVKTVDFNKSTGSDQR